jgi:DNA-binding NarL/FixJ family response regulator
MNQTILIIDGHPAYIYKTEGFLQGLTFKYIVLATNAKEGIERARRDAPDLIILSGMLPDADSLQVCKDLKRLAVKELKIIVQVGLFTEQEAIDAFISAGADTVLERKEKDMQPLHDAIETLLLAFVKENN